jgi:transposase
MAVCRKASCPRTDRPIVTPRAALAKVEELDQEILRLYAQREEAREGEDRFLARAEHAEQLLAEALTEFEQMADRIDKKAAELSDYDLGRLAVYKRAVQFLASQTIGTDPGTDETCKAQVPSVSNQSATEEETK